MKQGIKYAKQMWVHPAFLKKIKRDAVDKEMSIIAYTRLLGNENNTPIFNNSSFEEERKENKRKTYLGLRL